MRKRLLTLVAAGVLVSGAAFTAKAQDNAQQPQMQGRGFHGRQMDPDTQLAHMTRELNLTTDQQAQIRPLLVDHQQKMQQLFQDQSLAAEDRRAKAREIGADTHKKIDALLTDEQKQKEQAMHERMGRGGNGPDAPAQPQQ